MSPCPRFLLAAGVCLGAMSAADAWAQVNVAATTGATDPGRIEKRFEQPRKPQSVIEGQAPEIDEQMPPEQSDCGFRFIRPGIPISIRPPVPIRFRPPVPI